MAFAVTDGALAQIDGRGPSWSLPHIAGGIHLATDVAQSYGEIYRAQPAVRTVVDFLARNIAGLDLHTFERVDDLDRRRLGPADHPVAGFFTAQPGYGPNTTTTPYRLVHAVVSDKAIYDRAYLIKIRDTGGRVVGVRRIPVRRVNPLDGDWFETNTFRISGTRGHIDVPRSEVVEFAGYDPEDTRKGVSPIETLRQVLAEEFAAAQYRGQLWRNGARMAGFLSRPADAPDWNDGGRERFLSDFRAQYTGSGPQAGGVPLLEDGMTFVAAGVTPKDAQYVESRKLTREEAASAYHIAPPLIGILDHATFSNIKEQHINLYQDTLGPWLTGTEQDIIMQLLPDFPTSTVVYVEFNIKAKLAGDFETEAKVLQAAIGAPYMTPNEGRARLNLPQIEGADNLVVPLNVTTGGLANPQDTAPPDNGKAFAVRGDADRAPRRSVVGKAGQPAGVKAQAPDGAVDEHAAALVAFFERQARSVTAKHGAAGDDVTLAQVWDRARWDRELAADLGKLSPAIVAAVAADVLDELDADPDVFDAGMTVNFLAAWNDHTAGAVNTVTEQQVQEALDADDPTAALADVFTLAVAQRASQIARTQVTGLSGWSATEAARQGGHGGARKQWLTGANPRKSHAAMNGQTAALDDTFSNGCRWPADAVNGTADEVAGCNCSLVIIPEGVE